MGETTLEKEEGVEDSVGSTMRILETYKYNEEVVRLAIMEMIIR